MDSFNLRQEKNRVWLFDQRCKATDLGDDSKPADQDQPGPPFMRSQGWQPLRIPIRQGSEQEKQGDDKVVIED